MNFTIANEFRYSFTTLTLKLIELNYMILKIHTEDNIILRSSLSKSYKFNHHTLPYRYIYCVTEGKFNSD